MQNCFQCGLCINFSRLFFIFSIQSSHPTPCFVPTNCINRCHSTRSRCLPEELSMHGTSMRVVSNPLLCQSFHCVYLTTMSCGLCMAHSYMSCCPAHWCVLCTVLSTMSFTGKSGGCMYTVHCMYVICMYAHACKMPLQCSDPECRGLPPQTFSLLDKLWSGRLKTRDWKTRDWKTREHNLYG